MKRLKAALLKYGVIVRNEEERRQHVDRYIEQRLWISIAYSLVFAIFLIYSVYQWRCGGTFSTFCGGFLFGMIGLTVRSWSFLNQGESPFPPYVLTYPIIVILGCPLIVLAARHNTSAELREMLTLVVAGPCFILGYGPMDFIKKWK